MNLKSYTYVPYAVRAEKYEVRMADSEATMKLFFMPALLLNDIQKKTVPVMIATLRSADFTKFDMGKVYMLMVMAILPVMVIYVILSKSIIKGVTSGSVKG